MYLLQCKKNDANFIILNSYLKSVIIVVTVIDCDFLILKCQTILLGHIIYLHRINIGITNLTNNSSIPKIGKPYYNIAENNKK